ncbi:MAG: 23S rRNA (adenine(1618)-N(6))-methyltransferase RlmF [Gammaproteobacteria bacterium]|nr:23S rRNA (adenine(1618)-N(6))-methyltransferase RlmF [Gammaproteobacteria bacterium]
MPQAPYKKPAQSSSMHPRNIHTGRYDLALLSKTLPELQPFLTKNPSGQHTIPFSDPTAVKLLNKALLMQYYGISHWDIPTGFLCPPIPSRADYIHHIADFLEQHHRHKNHKAKPFDHTNIVALDIGTGANCIYPIISSHCYGWQCIVSDIDSVSLDNVKTICKQNSALSKNVIIRKQHNADNIFKGIIKKDDSIDITICNPPFHASLAEATAASNRKTSNLQRNKIKRQSHNRDVKHDNALNFGGQKSELWCSGGEIAFLRTMVRESKGFANNVRWFSSLVSKSENVAPIQKLLKKLQAAEVHIITMRHGQKSTRVILWSW